MADIKWIKITTDIFDDEKILLIEALPDADAVLVIWLKLLCLAGKQNNSGVFVMNDRIAYTDEMLATIFRRPLNTVRMALDVFEGFGMIDRIDGVISIPNWEKHQSIDALDKMREQTRERVARHREKQKAICNVTCNDTVTFSNATEKKREEKKREEKNRIYYPEDEKLNDAFVRFIEHRKKMKKPLDEYKAEGQIKKLDKLSGGDPDLAIAIIQQSIDERWVGLFELKANKQKASPNYVDNSGAIDWSKV